MSILLLVVALLVIAIVLSRLTWASQLGERRSIKHHEQAMDVLRSVSGRRTVRRGPTTPTPPPTSSRLWKTAPASPPRPPGGPCRRRRSSVRRRFGSSGRGARKRRQRGPRRAAPPASRSRWPRLEGWSRSSPDPTRLGSRQHRRRCRTRRHPRCRGRQRSSWALKPPVNISSRRTRLGWHRHRLGSRPISRTAGPTVRASSSSPSSCSSTTTPGGRVRSHFRRMWPPPSVATTPVVGRTAEETAPGWGTGSGGKTTQLRRSRSSRARPRSGTTPRVGHLDRKRGRDRARGHDCGCGDGCWRRSRPRDVPPRALVSVWGRVTPRLRSALGSTRPTGAPIPGSRLPSPRRRRPRA
jgi:hypothetical protein